MTSRSGWGRWRTLVASAALVVVLAPFTPTLTACSAGHSDGNGNASAVSQASESQSAEAAPSGEPDESADSASQSSPSSASQATNDSPSSASASSKSAGRKIDSRAFDERGNVTLYAVCELDGRELQDSLENGGYQWSDGPRTWISPTGAMLEVQGENSLMSRDDIARLDSGAEGSSAAFVVTASGYDTPEAAIGGMSANVVVKKTHVNSSGDVAFASIRNSGKDDYLVVSTDMGGSQQTLLVFTEKAVEDGLFAEVTGISSVKSIEDLWKALGVQDKREGSGA